jgi:diaminohydroxyphosphoribosylaminopyrimidine deaminase/5-amino-6-(5-phosphoribosylamino)uracil reductase
VLELLWYREHRHVLLEGGPALAAAFWRAGLVDDVVATATGCVMYGSPDLRSWPRWHRSAVA